MCGDLLTWKQNANAGFTIYVGITCTTAAVQRLEDSIVIQHVKGYNITGRKIITTAKIT